jgi:hypothetical protein
MNPHQRAHIAVESNVLPSWLLLIKEVMGRHSIPITSMASGRSCAMALLDDSARGKG